MSTVERELLTSEGDTDAEAVVASLLSGRSLDPEVARRVTERSKTLREETAHKHGVREIAADLIREIRDGA